ncbi:MAG: glycosyltransferase family 9 protein [Bacteroidia bacterium]|nr:glycosyltransferase family 9 protein [Bacteroidia bacterium]
MPKILILRFSSIGDIVLTTPVIRNLKQQMPRSEIHYLTKQSFASILLANPYITKVYSFEKNIFEVVKDLRAEQYDYIIDLHKNIRSNQVIIALGVKSSSFPKLNLEKWLLVNFKINKLPSVHIVDRYFEALKNFNIKNDKRGLDFFIPDKDIINIHQLPTFLHNGYISMVIGAQHYTKRMPNQKIIELCNKLPLPVILIGGKEDKPNAQLIMAKVKETVYNACGEYNVFQSASIIQQSKLVITHDTGMMHIGAAFRKKIISIWGNTVPEFGMYPYMPSNPENSFIAEVKNLSCRPCSKIGLNKCPKGHFKCMNDIDINNIIKQALVFIA